MQMFVLAGGQGQRLRTHVRDTPKALAPVGDKPFLSIFFDFWIQQGVDEFVIGTGYLGEQISSYFGSRYRKSSVIYSREESPRGTGGALVLAVQRDLLPKQFFIANGDTLLNINARDMFDTARHRKSDVVVAVRPIPNLPSRYGTMTVSNGVVTQFTSTKKSPGAAAIEGSVMNAGVYVIGAKVSTYLRNLEREQSFESSFEAHLLPQLLASGFPINAYQTNGYFRDIGVPEDYEKFCQDYTSGLLPLGGLN